MVSRANIRRLLSAERGASMIELAITLPILCLILIGVTDLGFALREWVGVNSLVEAASLYVLRYANADGTEGLTNLYVSSPTDLTSAIRSAVGQTHSGIGSGEASLFITTACRCPATNGISCPQGSPGDFSATPPKCPDTVPQCSDTINASRTRQSDYICISATHTHQSLFGTRGWSPVFSTTAIINIH